MPLSAEQAVQQYGSLDILCANAGIFPSSSLVELSGDQWDEVFNVNTKGTLFSAQACLPFLRKSDAGLIVVISSITGPVTGFPGWSHYGASKAAQLGFIRTAALELSQYGIDVGFAVSFFASPEAGFITGQTLVVDGGQVLPESPAAI